MSRLIPGDLRAKLRQWHRDWVLRRSLAALQRDPQAAVAAGSPVLAGLIYGWGNQAWAASPEYIRACVLEALAARAPVLECGSGLSTLIVGLVSQRQRNLVYSLEHHSDWAAKVGAWLKRMRIRSVRINICPLRDYGDFEWYGSLPADLPQKWGLVICDGPPGSTTRGGRYGLLPLMRQRFAAGTVILLDDGGRPEEQAIAERWAKEAPASAETHGVEKPFIRLVLL